MKPTSPLRGREPQLAGDDTTRKTLRAHSVSRQPGPVDGLTAPTVGLGQEQVQRSLTQSYHLWPWRVNRAKTDSHPGNR